MDGAHEHGEPVEAELRDAVSPGNFVNIRTIYGGTAPSETRRALSVERSHEAADAEWIRSTVSALETAHEKLQDQVKKRRA